MLDSSARANNVRPRSHGHPTRAARVALCVIALSVFPPEAHAQPDRREANASTQPKLTKAPRLTQLVEAPFPESERAKGQGASVVMEMAIDATGNVVDVRVVASAGEAFDSAALAAARQFVFEPAEIDGKPAPVKLTYRYEFVLREPPKKVTSRFSGTVRDRRTGVPLPGVAVALNGGATATTDEKGAFVFEDLEPGKYTVALSGAQLKPVQTEETLEGGRAIEARYDVDVPPPEGANAGGDEDDMEIVIVAPPLSKQVVSTEVEATDAERVAGTQGDVLKVVQNLPGVTRSAAGSGEVVVWGAAPEDTRVYVEGVRVPALYHFGGVRSIVHSDLVRSVELIPGAYGAEYGRGLGGLVLVKLADPPGERLHASAQLDLLDASASVRGPVSDKLKITLAARRSHLRQVSEAFLNQDFEEFFVVPDYHDAQLGVRYELGSGQYVELSGLLSSDKERRNVPSVDPSARKSQERTLDFNRTSLRYRKRYGAGSSLSLEPWFGTTSSRRRAEFGQTPTELKTDSEIFGMRGEWVGPLSTWIDARTGMDFEVVRARAFHAGSVTAPPREGDPFVFGRAPVDQINADKYSTTIGSAAPYGELDLSFFSSKLHIIPGLRIEPFYTQASRRIPTEGDRPPVALASAEVSKQPRLAVRYAPISTVAFKLGYGHYRQPPAPEDLSAVFGNPGASLAEGDHYLAGGSVQLATGVTLETTAFYTVSEHLAVRNPLESPLVSEALLSLGQGRSFGSQFLLRRDRTGRLFGWVAYTLLRSERKDGPNSNWRLFDFDQTHVLTALAAYDLGKGFDVGVRGRAATGFPRTPVVGQFYDARNDRFEPILGPLNSDRIPAFFQADIRVAKTFKFSGSELETYLDVQNVTNRENPEEIAYSADFKQRRYITGLPLLPVVGARFSY